MKRTQKVERVAAMPAKKAFTEADLVIQEAE